MKNGWRSQATIAGFLVMEFLISVLLGNQIINYNITWFSSHEPWALVGLWISFLIIPYLLFLIVYLYCSTANGRISKKEINYYARAPFYLIQLPFMINMIIDYEYSFDIFLLFFAVCTILFEILIFPFLDTISKRLIKVKPFEKQNKKR